MNYLTQINLTPLQLLHRIVKTPCYSLVTNFLFVLNNFQLKGHPKTH